MARVSALGSARAMGATVLVWGMLPLLSVGCGHDTDRDGVLPAEVQRGDPEVYWRHQGELRGAEPTAPMEPTLTPKASRE